MLGFEFAAFFIFRFFNNEQRIKKIIKILTEYWLIILSFKTYC